jgi:uncharacterized membrane protein
LPSKRTPHERASTRTVAPRTAATPAALPPVSRRAWIILGAMMAAYAGTMGFLAVVKYRYYLFLDIDLPIFLQATDQALRGTLFSSIRGMNWLGDHVSLILFVVAPLYALIRHPLTLLLLQCLALALGAWPVFSLARRQLKNEGVALMFAGLYLFHPAVGYSNLFQFHPEVLATATLLATFASVAAGRIVPTVVFAILSVLCREDVAMVVTMLGLITLLPGRPRRIGVALVGVGLTSLIVSFGVLLPAFSSGAAEYGRMYADWGGNLRAVAFNVLIHPVRAVSALFDTPGNPGDTALKHAYWPEMLWPLLFLPLLSPVTLVCALPVFAEHFLSSRDQQHRLVFQYTALVTPVLVASAIYGLANLIRFVTRSPVATATMNRPGAPRSMALGICGAALASSLLCNLLYGPLLYRGWIPFDRTTEMYWPTMVERTLRPYRDQMVKRVPADGGVVTGFEFLPRFASRRDVHSLHHLYTGLYTFSTKAYPMPTGVHAMLADVGDPMLAKYVKGDTPARLRELAEKNHLRPTDAAGDLLLFTPATGDTVDLITIPAPAPPVVRQANFDGEVVLEGFSLPRTPVVPNGLMPIETYWRRIGASQRLLLVQFLLSDANGAPAFSVIRHLGYLMYPPYTWPVEVPVRETYRLIIPDYVSPGSYTLGVRLLWLGPRGRLGVANATGTGITEGTGPVSLGSFVVEKAPGR